MPKRIDRALLWLHEQEVIRLRQQFSLADGNTLSLCALRWRLQESPSRWATKRRHPFGVRVKHKRCQVFFKGGSSMTPAAICSEVQSTPRHALRGGKSARHRDLAQV